MDLKDMQRLNETVKKFRKTTLSELKAQFPALDIKHVKRSPSEVPALSLLKANTSSSYGLVNRVSFKFPRHMVFVHKGVGGGNTTNRKAKEWFNPPIDKGVEQLADELAEQHAELAVNAINIK